LDQADAEQMVNGPVTGYSVSGMGQNHILTTSFIWSYLIILINFQSRFGRLMAQNISKK
jgi:hypothetical protein